MALQFRLWKIPSDEELEFLNEHNPPLRFERTLDGALSLSPPTGFATGEQNSELNRLLDLFAIFDELKSPDGA